MFIKTTDKYMKEYLAELINYTYLYDGLYQVSYYDDEGLLINDTVLANKLFDNMKENYELH